MANLENVLTIQMCNVCLASVADDVADTVADATARVALVLDGAAEAGPHVVRLVPVQTLLMRTRKAIVTRCHRCTRRRGCWGSGSPTELDGLMDCLCRKHVVTDRPDLELRPHVGSEEHGLWGQDSSPLLGGAGQLDRGEVR